MPLITQPDPTLTDRYALPDWYQKSARESKQKYLLGKVNEGLATYGTAAYEGRDEEERRGKAEEEYLRDASAKANQPTITQGEIARRFGRAGDTAAAGFAEASSALRDYIGESGVSGGGMVNGLLANAELARLRQLTTARGDLMSFKATQDALDRQRAFDRARVVGQSINRPISMLGIDYENQALQTQQGLFGLEVQRGAAKEMANATRDAGTKQMIGGLGGAAIGALGGIF